MKDTIYRDDAIDAVLLFMVEYCGAAFDEDMQTKMKQRLEDLSSAQPEIIRCGECRHYRTCEIFGKKITLCKRREYDALSVEPDDFCSYAERKE